MSTIKTNQLAHTANGASIYTLPQTDGSAGQVLQTNGSGALSFATPTPTISEGSYSSALSGTYVDITVDSTDVIKYDLLFENVSLGGGMNWLFRLGDSGGIESTGYTVAAGYFSNSSYGATSSRTDSFNWRSVGDASFLMDGKFSLYRFNGNTWWGEGVLSRNETSDGTLYQMRGKKTLSGALTTIRIQAAPDLSESFDSGHYKLITYK